MVGQLEQAPGLLLDQDSHHDELRAVIIRVSLYLKYGKWGIKSMRNSAFKWNMDFVFAYDHVDSPDVEGQKPPKDT